MTARLLRLLVFPLALLIGASGAALPAAGANTLCVNQGGVSPCFGTIQAAIDAAAPGDTIHIAGGSPYLERLTIAKGLSLIGDDAATTIIDGASLGQVLHITGTVTVILTNLTIRHGQAGLGDTPDHWGGGIHNEVATLTLNNVVVSSNQTGGQNFCCVGNGGGIYNGNATLTLNHSTVSANSTASPASNSPNGFNGGNAGGIFNDSGIVILNDSTISGNHTGDGSDGATVGGFGGFGAGVDNFHGALIVNRGTISGNITGNGGSGLVGGPGGSGGGLYNDMGTMSIFASTISGNQTGTGGSGTTFGRSGLGGGIAVNGTGSFTPNLANITDSTISANATGQGLAGSRFGDGGGLYAEFANAINLTNATVAYNTVDPGQKGGGIAAGPFTVLNLKNSLVAYNRTTTGPSSFTDCAGTLHSQGYNAIFEIIQPSCAITATTGDLFSQAGLLVAPLANNGGPTLTNALLPGSIAVDAADNSTCPPMDQRGFKRPVFGGTALRCDIGAFEL